MAATVINLNGINELDLTLPGTTTATVSNGVVSVVNTGTSGYSLGGTVTVANVALGSGAGTGATIDVVAGLDGSHFIEITTGTSTQPLQPVWVLTFTVPRTYVSYAILSPLLGSTPGTYTSFDQYVSPGNGNISYAADSGSTPLLASTTYQWNVSCP